MSGAAAAVAAVIGGAIGSFAATIAVVVGLYSLLWIFVFGDDPWPDWVMTAVDLAVPILGLFFWGLFGLAIWRGLRPKSA